MCATSPCCPSWRPRTTLITGVDSASIINRWSTTMSIHMKDMKSLPVSIKKKFQLGQLWVVPKTSNKFFGIPVNQAHKQDNKTVKILRGAVGLTENHVTFRYVEFKFTCRIELKYLIQSCFLVNLLKLVFMNLLFLWEVDAVWAGAR